MVDFIKLYWNDKSRLEPFVTDKTNFEVLYSVLEEHTGEISYPKKTKIENMLVVVCKNSAYVKNSIHKLYNLLQNKSEHNHNEFNYSNLIWTIDKLSSQLTDLSSAVVTQLEFGFNITTEIPAEVIIENSVLMYDYKGYNHDKEYHGKGKLKQFDRSTYLIKVYDKAKQYGLEENILRFELKLFRRNGIKNLGIIHLDDLKDKTLLKNLFDLTLKRFDDMIIIDSITESNNISLMDQKSLGNYLNPNFWHNKFEKVHPEARARHKRKFNALLIKYDLLKLKETLRSALIEKFKVLINN